MFIQEYRRPGRQAPDYSDTKAAHGSKVKEPGFSHPPRFFDTPLLRSITNGTLIHPLPVRRSSIAKVGHGTAIYRVRLGNQARSDHGLTSRPFPFSTGVPSMPRYTPRMRREDHVGRKHKSTGRPAPDGLVYLVILILPA